MTTIPVTLYLMSHYVFIDNQIHLRNKHTETMKKENRQTFRLWLTCLAAVCALNLSAQKFEYPVHGENDTVRIAVSFKGKQPVIECVPAQKATAHIAGKFGFVRTETRDGLDVYRLIR